MSGAHRHRGGPDRWLLSYADLVTLLLAFFTTLYAASTVNARKLSFDEPGAGTPIAETVMEQLREQLDAELAEVVEASRVEVTRDIRGLVVSLPEDAAFSTGSNSLAPGALDIIRRVALAVAPHANPIRIEGHTDDVPIRTSNWELSTARAASVVAYLVGEVGLDPARLSAAGYGEFHPLVPNDSAANRARNRRIDLVIVETAQRPSGQVPNRATPGALGVVEPGAGGSR
jgi:chemotaxis protein MotB